MIFYDFPAWGGPVLQGVSTVAKIMPVTLNDCCCVCLLSLHATLQLATSRLAGAHARTLASQISVIGA